MTDIAKTIAILVGVITVAKFLWSVAEFFIGMSRTLKVLSDNVERLTHRFEEHYIDVSDGLQDVRMRLTALETWRSLNDE